MEKLPQMTAAELKDRIKDGHYMLFFSADWCPDCNFIKPVMPEIEAEYPQYHFLLVDRDENIDLAGELGVMGIPSFIAYDHGNEVGRFVNGDRKTRQEVETFIDTVA
ncbi:thioredoxin family protein [Levilactobacillus bambusae]|uniref:Thiol reductase thioredoxin n=1 Tax=Levilactobacillus bambusae TaxID=2024736 RepID=A0A2V1MZH7_9LACO|nr:thioredoxin family protein [Levilactobacillus bambusae]PWG00222.1 thiol reductase thioredoxin [Levilactobacillus bambusae]